MTHSKFELISNARNSNFRYVQSHVANAPLAQLSNHQNCQFGQQVELIFKQNLWTNFHGYIKSLFYANSLRISSARARRVVDVVSSKKQKTTL